jgi:ssDNA-binding Zn-finger/Zn-ribbon topoisomerase 1
MKLAKCPLCGGEADEFEGYLTPLARCSNLPECQFVVILPARVWNRLASLVRKGRMFEWLERQMRSFPPRPAAITAVGLARRWWRWWRWWRRRKK